MATQFTAKISKDFKNKKVHVVREFDASPDLVWRAWTEADLLDQWWAPRPWMAKTKSMRFGEGGSWLYAMTGPDGQAIWSIVEFSAVKKNKSFEALSSFCDENGTKNSSFPPSRWKNVFIAAGQGTKVEVELSFDKEADMQQLVNMGFEEGFTSALGNLDELLAKQ